jgi:hypothetical protein
VADDYLPPVVAEILLRTDGFADSSADIRSDMSGMAASIDADADKASQSIMKIATSAENAADVASKANLKIATSAIEAGDATRIQATAMNQSAVEQVVAYDRIADAANTSAEVAARAGSAQADAALRAAEAQGAATDSEVDSFEQFAEAANAAATAQAEASGRAISSFDAYAAAANYAASSATEAQARMAAGIDVANDDIIASNAKLDASNEGVLTSARGLAGGLGKELIAALGIGYGIDKAVEAWDSFDKAQVALQTAVKNSGASFDALAPKIKAAEAAGQSLGFNNAQVAQSLQQLTTSTDSPTKALQQLGLAENLARIKNIDLATATQTLTRLNAGSTRALTQLGLNLDVGSGKLSSIRTATEAVSTAQTALTSVQNEVSSGQLTGISAANSLTGAHQKLSIAERNLAIDQGTLAKITDTLNQRLQGAAQAFAGTLPGQIAILKADLDHVGITVGHVLVPALDDLLKGIERVGSDMYTAAKAVADFLNMLGPLKPLIEGTAVAFAALTAAQWAFDAAAAANPYVVIAVGIVALSVAVVELAKHWHDVWQGIESISQAVGNVVINNVIDPMISAINTLINEYNKFFGWLTGNIGRLNKLGDIHLGVTVGSDPSAAGTGLDLTPAYRKKALAAEAEGLTPGSAAFKKATGIGAGPTNITERIKEQAAAEADRTKRIVDAHKKALEDLANRLVALQQAHDIASLNLQAAQVTGETKIAQDAAASQVTVIKDQQALQSDAMQAAAKNISDSASVMSARMSAAATAITDASTVGQDKSAAVVQGMQDATQVQADILGERMLYGYELVAQRLQVQLDATKEGFDKQIAVAQEHLDEDKQHWDGRIAAATINEARVTQHEDQLVAIAQQHEAIVQMHADTLLGNATVASDTAQLAASIKVALAQNAVTLSASAKPAQVQAAAQALTLAQSEAGVGTANAADALEKVTANTNLVTTQAAGAYQKAQDTAAINEAKSQATLTKIQGQAQINEAKDQAKLDKLNETMNKVVQKLQDQITLAQAGGGQRIKSDATSLAYTGLGALGKGGGGNIVNNLGPAATGVGIAQETATEKRRGRGDIHIHGGVNISGAGKDKGEIVHDWYLKTRSLM